MKKISIISLTLLVFLLLGAVSVFGKGENQWRYSKEVCFENKGEVKAIYLDEEIYRLAKEDLSDLRLVNEKNEFIPYYIYNSVLSENKVEHIDYKGKEILSFMKGNDYYIDYEITPIKENRDVIGNKLKVEVLKDSFYKEVQIFGSYDNKSWERIKSDTIYRVDGVEKLTIALDETYKYPYYRLVSINDPSGVVIDNMSLEYDVNEATYKEHEGFKKIEYKVEVKKESNETILKIHNKDRLRINSIRIVCKDDFNRGYTLYTVNEQGERLEQVGEGKIYSLNLEQFKAEDTTIPIEGITGNFVAAENLRVVINDRDDYPLNIESVEVGYYIDKMVFKSKESEKVYLLFGNDQATKPDYDIDTYIEEIEKVNQESTNLSNLVERPIEKKDIEVKPEEKHFDFKWILNSSIVLISGLLIVVIVGKSRVHMK